MSEGREEPRCATMEPLLHALADGELDAANALRCEAHLRCCRHCAAAYDQALVVRSAIRQKAVRHRAPEHLQARILAALDAAAPVPAAGAAVPRPARAMLDAVAAPLRRWWSSARLPALALATGLAALALVVAPRQWDEPAAPDLRREVVEGHLRSLLVAGRLMDVGSSDRHTVKPWFAGRLDFSPPVPDLADAGFPLAGGRLDYFDGRAVAALVYRRREHVINVFVWPDAAAGADTAPRPAGTAGSTGHAVIHWREGGLGFWAVSDLNEAELTDFARLFAARTSQAPPS